MLYSSKAHFTYETRDLKKRLTEQEGGVKVIQAGRPSQGFLDGQTTEKGRRAFVFP